MEACLNCNTLRQERDELLEQLDKRDIDGHLLRSLSQERDELRAKLEVARAALEDIKTSGGRASIHGLDILRCPTCASAELACEALDKLNEELKK